MLDVLVSRVQAHYKALRQTCYYYNGINIVKTMGVEKAPKMTRIVITLAQSHN